jgi:hypothetical protein
MIVKKKAHELAVGDKILGNTNFYVINELKPSSLTGVTYPVIEVTDAYGNKKTIETGANEKFQDHIYEVDTQLQLSEIITEQPKKTKKEKKAPKVKKVVKKPVKKVAAPKKKVKVKAKKKK